MTIISLNDQGHNQHYKKIKVPNVSNIFDHFNFSIIFSMILDDQVHDNYNYFFCTEIAKELLKNIQHITTSSLPISIL